MIKNTSEKGQTIVLVVISVIIMVVMAALVVDGGNSYLKRRQAQTAADAAALAAAQEFCVNNGSILDADGVATEYALVQNDGTAMIDLSPVGAPDGIAPFILINATSNEVEVAVEISQPSFFARMLGRPTITVSAQASAGCFPPGAADHVLPVAWTCRPPLPGIPSDSPDCEWKAIPWSIMEDIIADPLFEPLGATGTVLYDSGGDTPLSYMGGAGTGALSLYLIMDTIPSSSDIPCIQTDPINGTVDCDLDGDGRIDILGNGDRSWLILDGDSNNAQLDDIIRGEVEFGITAPTWYPGRDGAIADVYKDANDFIEGTPNLIPVFEVFCAPTSNPLEDPLCASLVEAEDGLVQISTAASGTYYRVVSFAEFYVTCVSEKLSDKCPGKELALSYGLITQSTPSIEGYFVDGWAANDKTIGSGSSDIDLGVYVLSLTE